MKTYIDVALLIGFAVWAVLEFYVRIEFGHLNALILFGVILRFAVMPALGQAGGKPPE